MPRARRPRLADALDRLVRGCRAAAAVARGRRVAVGRARERVHAAADAGRAGRPAVGGVDRAVADARRRSPPSRRRRRCARGTGSATRAVRSGCTGRRSRSSSGTAARCPRDLDALLALQGVGPYTARAIAAFAFGLRHPVVDTNTRRVHRPRRRSGRASPVRRRRPATSRRWRRCCPMTDAAARSVQRRGDGARRDGVHRARPACDACPIAAACAWRAGGLPAVRGPRQGRAGAVRGIRPAGARTRHARAACGAPPRRPGELAPGLARCRPARARASTGSSPTGSRSPTTTGLRLPDA